MSDIKQYNYWEHASDRLNKGDFPKDTTIKSKRFGSNTKRYCFEIAGVEDIYKLDVGYYIGVDWLLENHSSIIIAPKLNSRLESLKIEKDLNEDIELDAEELLPINEGKEVYIDYFAMLDRCLDVDYLYYEIDNLVHIDWKANEIPIKQSEDWLSPLLIVKFLNLLKVIVRKGLKKSYYQTRQNLNGKIKGKILVGLNIKQNIVRNKLTHTMCQFEEFGVDNLENRLLKKAFVFAATYLDNYQKAFHGIENHFDHIVNYCRPALEPIGNDVNVIEVKNHKVNPFFKEYNEAIQIAKLLLRRFAYSVSNTSKEKLTTPPYWIDMPKLFELYTYYFLKCRFSKPKMVNYHLSTYGNELDLLVNGDGFKIVVDAKYKPLYIFGKNHQDMRQVSGYSRLEKVYDLLDIDHNKLIGCLIIYPDVQNGLSENEFMTANLKLKPISGYSNIYKVGIKVPVK
jgi:hypothetical protein